MTKEVMLRISGVHFPDGQEEKEKISGMIKPGPPSALGDRVLLSEIHPRWLSRYVLADMPRLFFMQRQK